MAGDTDESGRRRRILARQLLVACLVAWTVAPALAGASPALAGVSPALADTGIAAAEPTTGPAHATQENESTNESTVPDASQPGSDADAAAPNDSVGPNATQPGAVPNVSQPDTGANATDGETGLPAADGETPAQTSVGAPPVLGDPGNVTVTIDDDRSIRASEAGTVTLAVENEGDEDATDVVLTLQAAGDAVALGTPAAPATTRSISIGDLDDGDEETVTVDVVAADVTSGTYPLFASVQYRVDAEDDGDDDDDEDDSDDSEDDEDDGDDSDDSEDDEDDDTDDTTVRTDGPDAIQVPVEAGATLDVTGDGEIPVDGEGTYDLRVANDGNDTVSGVVATVEAGPPLSSESPTAYVGTLDPGEERTVPIPLETSSDAVETTTAVSVGVSYETASGDRVSEDPESIPVEIVNPDDETDVNSVVPLAAAVAVVAALLAVWWFRRS